MTLGMITNHGVADLHLMIFRCSRLSKVTILVDFVSMHVTASVQAMASNQIEMTLHLSMTKSLHKRTSSISCPLFAHNTWRRSGIVLDSMHCASKIKYTSRRDRSAQRGLSHHPGTQEPCSVLRPEKSKV